MKRKVIYISSLVLVVIIMLCILFFSIINNNGKSVSFDIDNILETPSYSYLSDNAKEFIKEYYKDNNTILYTEKNKRTNEPYLNPLYIEYLDSSEDVDVIPDVLVVDYIPNNKVAAMPSSFDLRDSSVISPVKNQGSSGLCWAYSSNSILYANLLLNKKTPYIFSERQLDYATAGNGVVDDYTFYNHNRGLYYDGNSFSGISEVLTDGLGMVRDAWDNDSVSNNEQQEASYVYNLENSMYEVNETIFMPVIDPYINDSTYFNNYINEVKEKIQLYGGAWVATKSPQTKCYITDNSGSRFIYNDGSCSIDHAMHIIGWDDNYTYSYCMNNGTLSNNKSGCTNLIEGKGAWLVKNSWLGDASFVYLAYKSLNSQIGFFKDASVRNWDNIYKDYKNSNDEIIFNKNINNSESLKKIKFYSGFTNADYSVYVYYNNNYNLVKSFKSSEMGYHSVDINNIPINNNEIKLKIYIKINSNTYYCDSYCRVKAFTVNNNDNVVVNTYDTSYENVISNSDNYVFRVKSDVRNILDNSKVTYKILDSNNNEIKYNYSYLYNSVFVNRLYTLFSIDNRLEKGNYKINTIYNNKVVSTSNLIIDKDIIVTSGDGTINNPYIVDSKEKLNLVRLKPSAYYKLVSDIDLSYDTTNSNGLFYNNGLGWEPIEFSGGFDGNNHTIKGLYINRVNEDMVGLFKSISSESTNTYISNLNLSNVNINGKDYVGGVVGEALEEINSHRIHLSNLSVSGKIKGNDYVGGVIGLVSMGSLYYESLGTNFENLYQYISSLYNEASVNGNNNVGGIIGSVHTNDYYQNASLMINALYNRGSVEAKKGAGLIGNVLLNDNNLYLFDSINIGHINTSCGVVYNISRFDAMYDSYFYIYNLYYNNTYANIDGNSLIQTYNTFKKNNIELVGNIYNNWSFKISNISINFSDYWKKENIDGVDRIPILKNMNFEYSKAHDIEVSIYDSNKYNICEYVYPCSDINYSIMDTKVAFIDEDGYIHAAGVGNTKLHLINNYDGYDGYINIIVTNKIYEYNITYNANGGIGTMNSDVKKIDSNLCKNLFTKVGYKFVGWNIKSDGSGNSYNDLDSIANIHEDSPNIILYAMWDAIVYHIKYDSNGGTGSMDNDTFEYDSKNKLSLCSFRNGSKMFLEWNTKSDGSGIRYNDEDEVINLSQDDGSEVILYAIWEDSNIEIDTSYEIEEDYIYRIDNNTNYSSFKENVNVNNNTVKCYDKSGVELLDNNLIFTGSITKIFDLNNRKLLEYVNVVHGDNSGDGRVNVVDVVNAYTYIMKEIDVNRYAFKASDINRDLRLNVVDVTKLYSYCMGKGVLS